MVLPGSSSSSSSSPPTLILVLGAIVISLLVFLNGHRVINDAGSGHVVLDKGGVRAGEGEVDGEARKRVPVSLYVMSKCPDAAICEPIFADVLSKIGDIVSIETDYITKSNDNGKTLTCLHGPEECTGNKQQLCAHEQAKEEELPRNKWFDFVTCQAGEYRNIPQPGLVEKCADKVDLDAKEIQKCANSDLGDELLRASAERTKASGATKSCTVFIGGKQKCFVDGGSWSGCSGKVADFLESVCDEYEKIGGDRGAVGGCPSKIGKKVGGGK